ncbi:MAG: hypothetical protein M3Q23_18015 [Actinomycetota bacterium]|nr:hypothetical protein [Actinomycetota bacterium]
MTEAELHRLAGPPVILQRCIRASRHLRVVTIRDEVFVASLRAAEVDWRSNEINHERFRPEPDEAWPCVRQGATALAAALQIGFSAQDWIVDNSGRPFFLEVNPNGQWLFLDPLWDGRIGESLAMALERLASDGS